MSKRFGAIAQLGERLVRNEEVAGPIPVGSTKWSPDAHSFDTRIERAIALRFAITKPMKPSIK